MEVKTKEIKEVDIFKDVEPMVQKREDVGAYVINSPVIRFNGVLIITGKGSPLNVVSAPLGSLYLNQSGGANVCLYAKETEVVKGDKTGWIAR